jgi:hypothetical protein
VARRVNELHDLRIDEVSLVDKGANQHARTVIAKRHDEEEEMKYFDAQGNPVDDASLQPGDTVYDEAGNAFEAVEDDDDDFDGDEEGNPFDRSDERELASVGKSASFASIREELSKAMTDDARDEIIAKAFGQMAEYEEIAKTAQATAEQERQLRLDREYTEVAKNYSVGIEADVLGPVLKRAAESLSRNDCVVLAKALASASTAVDMFQELGSRGAGTNSDVFDQVEALAKSVVEKSADGGLTTEAAITKAFASQTDMYDQYLAEQQNR